jgi:hypothetical protein
MGPTIAKVQPRNKGQFVIHQGEFTSWSWQDECIGIITKGTHANYRLLGWFWLRTNNC